MRISAWLNPCLSKANIERIGDVVKKQQENRHEAHEIKGYRDGTTGKSRAEQRQKQEQEYKSRDHRRIHKGRYYIEATSTNSNTNASNNLCEI